MKTDDFDFELPEQLIAQTPIKNRDESRMLVLDKETGNIEHKHFNEIINYLNEGDTLVLNDTKVIPARLYGVKEDTNAVIEILMLKELGENSWECLTKPAKRIKLGTVVSFGDGRLKAICTEIKEEGIRVFELKYEGILFQSNLLNGTYPNTSNLIPKHANCSIISSLVVTLFSPIP